MTLRSAAEFVLLRRRDGPEEDGRAAREDAPVEVWHEVIAHHPDMRRWVAHNKQTAPEECAVRRAQVRLDFHRLSDSSADWPAQPAPRYIEGAPELIVGGMITPHDDRTARR